MADYMTLSVDSRPMTTQELFAEIARYPDPPKSFGSVFDVDTPGVSCIYFLHNEGRIEYVGKAKDLQKRIGGLSAFRHHALENDDEISWLEFDDDVLEFVECFYIWRCRPGRNFGRKNECLLKRIEARRK
jgi:hypothetical protein